MVNGTIKNPLLSSTEWIAYNLPRDINIPANSSVLSDNIVCDGAVIGDVVMVSPPVDCNGVGISCYVLSTNRLKMVLTNSTSSDVVLTKTGWRFKIIY